MMQLKMRHDQHLAEISLQLFKLQANLMSKEGYLEQLIKEREQVTRSIGLSSHTSFAVFITRKKDEKCI